MNRVRTTREEFKAGDIIRHFKRETLVNAGTQYMYKILGEAEHTETGDRLVIYQALYGDNKIYARPLDIFLSEVDRTKYPDIRQVYRFEKALNKIDVKVYSKDKKAILLINDKNITIGESQLIDFEEAVRMYGDKTGQGDGSTDIYKFGCDVIGNNSMYISVESKTHIITGFLLTLNSYKQNLFTFGSTDDLHTFCNIRSIGRAKNNADKYEVVEPFGGINCTYTFIEHTGIVKAISLELKEETK